MKNKNGVSFGLLSGIFWGLGLTISAYIFSIFTDLSPFVVAAAHDFLSIFILLAFLLVKEGKVRLSIFLNIRKRVPNPAAKIMAFTRISFIL